MRGRLRLQVIHFPDAIAVLSLAPPARRIPNILCAATSVGNQAPQTSAHKREPRRKAPGLPLFQGSTDGRDWHLVLPCTRSRPTISAANGSFGQAANGTANFVLANIVVVPVRLTIGDRSKSRSGSRLGKPAYYSLRTRRSGIDRLHSGPLAELPIQYERFSFVRE
jgi:hypothetical protein